ncbi:MAG TPA: hypothetical protein DIT25_00530 [Candidatus Moranbacteria bacterium]|nr:hypothetical protein [Candidatus Moranbacteria bacterium]
MEQKNRRKIEIFLLVLILALSAIFAVQVRFSVSGSAIALDKNAEIRPEEEIIIRFPMVPFSGRFVDGAEIIPRTDAKYRWRGKDLIIAPKKFWQPETGYKIILPAGRTLIYSKIERSEFYFSTVKYPAVTEVFPASGAKDVIFGIEDPIIVRLDSPVEGFYLDFNLDPGGAFINEVNPERTEFRLLPKENSDGQKYDLKINISYIGAKKIDDVGEEDLEEKKEIYAGSFETFSFKNMSWEKDFSARLDQARKYTRPKLKEGKYIDVNISQQILSIFENGKLIDSFLISSGLRGMDTPKGNFQVHNKAPRPWSKAYSLYMPYWMAIVPDGKYGLHELPEWPGGYKEGANHLGIPVSHGCVRLGVGSAKTVYDWVEIGTPVVIY